MRLTFMTLLLLPAQLAAQQAPIRVQLAHRIGCVECDGFEAFAAIQDLAVGTDRVFVLDRSAPFLRVFGLNGKPIRAFAKHGAGPGELRLPIHAGVRRGGELEVFDLTLRRFTRFDSGGAVVRTRTLSSFAVAIASPAIGSESYLLTSDFQSTQQPILRWNDGAAEAQEVVQLSADFPRLAPGEHARTPAFAASTAGFAVGDGVAEYRIRRFDSRGNVIGDIV